jgi:hypothetical protein
MTEDTRFRISCSWDVVYSTNLIEYVKGEKVHGKFFMGQQYIPSQSNSSPPLQSLPPATRARGREGREILYVDII